jgi:hypothetical protein
MCDLAQDVADWSKWRVEVSDERRRAIIVVPFHMVLRSTVRAEGIHELDDAHLPRELRGSAQPLG